jgi:hypothetical protein
MNQHTYDGAAHVRVYNLGQVSPRGILGWAARTLADIGKSLTRIKLSGVSVIRGSAGSPCAV